MGITILQLHKRSSYQYEEIQDKFAYNEANKSLALADGTTQSFNSGKWAEIITKSFVDHPTFEPQKVISIFTDCVQLYRNVKFEFSGNPAKASLEKTKQLKGGTATFIGLEFLDDNYASIISCGDTNFFCQRNKKVESFPFSELEELNAISSFINTEQLIQNKVDQTFFQTKKFRFYEDATYILATDALSRLILKNTRIIDELTEIDTFPKLLGFCMKYWENKDLEEDDVSAIIIRKAINKIQEIIPPTGFSFPKEVEPEFIPNSVVKQNDPIQLTNMQTQEIIHRLNGVANDFYQVKRSQRFLEMLLMVAISLIIINFLYSFFLEKSFTSKISDQMNMLQFRQKEIDSLNKLLQKNDKLQANEEPNSNSEDTNTAKTDISKNAVTPKKKEIHVKGKK
jgi:hypothetical protein